MIPDEPAHEHAQRSEALHQPRRDAERHHRDRGVSGMNARPVWIAS